MYTTYNREVINNLDSSTKYTEYLKTLSNGDIGGGGGGNIYDGGGGGLSRNRSQQRRSRRNNFQGSTPLLPVSDNEVKFANIFSPNESNALKLHLLQKTSSLPLLDHSDSSIARGGASNSVGVGDDDDDDGSVVDQDDPRLHNRRRSTAIGILHDNQSNNNSNAHRKGDPVANILYSTIRHGAATNSNNNSNNDYDNPSADETLHTGSDSKVDYDPHEPLAAVDQIALRHELLNNIRAISRATYFEDLYTGKVRRNSASPEAEILRLLENPNGVAGHRNIAQDSLGERTIPSKDTSLSRVDRWIKESSEVSSEAAQCDTDEDNKHIKHASLYHQSIWNEEDAHGKQKSKGKKTVGGEKGPSGVGGVSDTTTESDVETPSAYIRRTNKTTKYKQISKSTSNNPVTDYDSVPDNKHFSRNTDTTVVSRSMGKPIIPEGIIESSSSYLQSKYLNDSKPILHSNKNDRLLAVDSPTQHGARRPFSFGINSNSTDDLLPISVSLPNVAHNVSNSYHSTPLPMHATSFKTHSVSRPDNLNHSMANLSTTTTSYQTRLDKRKMNGASNEQVARRTMVHHQSQQKSLQQAPKGKTTKVNRAIDRSVPGLYTRLNMNQWVVKKVSFYVNGDDLYPRFDYRFRPGKDIRDLDQLLDILTKRFPTLPTGARYIFTMDGYLISGLDELIHENSYLVSSTRKFKAIKHEEENGQKGNKNGGGVRNGHKVLSKQLSNSDGNLQRSKRAAAQPQGQLFASQINSLSSKSVSDVPRLVAHVIEEASSTAAMLNPSPLMAREPIRIINGSRPSLQSQVLLNTKTSQPFEDLVRDLAMSVKVPKQPVGDCMKTLAGRQIRSYSQLRSELKAGQRAFFIYIENKPVAASTLKPTGNPQHSNKKGKPIVKAALGKVNSNSSSDLSMATTEGRLKDTRRKSHRQRQRSHSPLFTSPKMQPRLSSNSRSPSPYNFK